MAAIPQYSEYDLTSPHSDHCFRLFVDAPEDELGRAGDLLRVSEVLRIAPAETVSTRRGTRRTVGGGDVYRTVCGRWGEVRRKSGERDSHPESSYGR